jgi:hypothetical protein
LELKEEMDDMDEVGVRVDGVVVVAEDGWIGSKSGVN